MLKKAYQFGVQAALKEEGLSKEAGGALSGAKIVGQDTLRALKEFFTGKRIQDAFEEISKARQAGISGAPSRFWERTMKPERGQVNAAMRVLQERGGSGAEVARELLEESVARIAPEEAMGAARGELWSALKPYLATAGIGGAAIGAPPAARALFPRLGD